MTNRNLRPTLLAPTLLSALLVAGCASVSTRMQTAGRMEQAISGPQRSSDDRARDVYRHPKETLLFFGLRPEMTVLEIDPGAGWYTRVLAPVLRDRGRYIAALPGPDGEADNQSQRQQLETLRQEAPLYFDKVEFAPFVPGQTIVPDGTVDLIVTFRNVHNWMASGTATAAFQSMYRALKPGGVLGVVEHRGNPAVAQDPQARSGYVNQQYAIDLILKAGFRLVATSEINANPKDTKDYPGGVWTLPPVLAEGDNENRVRYQAIGESDRFTLKFVRPHN
jgi:predicted methyltransferase